MSLWAQRNHCRAHRSASRIGAARLRIDGWADEQNRRRKRHRPCQVRRLSPDRIDHRKGCHRIHRVTKVTLADMVAASVGSNTTVYVPVVGREAMSKPPLAPLTKELELSVVRS